MNQIINQLINKIMNQSINQIINQLIKQSTVIQQVSMIQINVMKYKLLLTITTLIIKIKFNDINNLINGIKNNTISEADTKNKINELNEIKKVEKTVKDLLKSKKNY